jgi:hypothetical protein
MKEEERISLFINDLNNCLKPNHEIVKSIFNNEYGFPALDPLRDEICKCFLCGLYQSTITLTNHLLERSLKFCLASKYTFETKEKDNDIRTVFKEGIDKYDNSMLEQTINAACTQGIITKEQKKELKDFRHKFRNPYSHAFNNIFEGKKVTGKVISSADLENGIDNFFKHCFDKATDEEFDLENLPFAQGIMQVKIAKEDSFPYFKRVDEIIREMLNKIVSSEK